MIREFAGYISAAIICAIVDALAIWLYRDKNMATSLVARVALFVAIMAVWETARK